VSFRERPEYQDWREAVFRLFGRQCILCRHCGNISAHHVRPVNEYPELVFDPRNGVPLCGNCHAEVNGNELAYVEELIRRQRAILGGESAGLVTNEPREPELRARAYAEPSNFDAVAAWYEVASAQAVSEFYDQHREDSTMTGWHCGFVAACLKRVGRWQDVIAVAEKGMELSESEEGTLDRSIGKIGRVKSEALEELGRLPEAIAFLRELVSRFPENSELHHALSTSLFDVYRDGEDKKVLEESAHHALEAARLAPDNFDPVRWAVFVLAANGDYASALRCGKQALAIASTNEQRARALLGIARTYKWNGLYADARGYLRQILQIDDCSVEAIGDLASCYYAEENSREAIRMAKLGLMLDPNNELCRDILRRCGV